MPMSVEAVIWPLYSSWSEGLVTQLTIRKRNRDLFSGTIAICIRGHDGREVRLIFQLGARHNSLLVSQA